jgi:hypothetical protein
VCIDYVVSCILMKIQREEKKSMHRNKTNAAHCSRGRSATTGCRYSKHPPYVQSNFYRRCRFRLQGPDGGFSPKRPPQKSKGRASVQPLTVTRNRSMGTAGNVPVSTRKFHQMSMSRRILPPQEPQRSTTSLHNSPKLEQLFLQNIAQYPSSLLSYHSS